MRKSLITRLFLGGVVAVVAGAVLTFAALWLAFANGAFVLDGPDVVGIEPTAIAWTWVGVAVLGCLAVMAGFIAGLVAWIGALVNTAQLTDKTWFVLLLALGLVSFGFVAMLAYVLAGPDGYDGGGGRPVQLPA